MDEAKSQNSWHQDPVWCEDLRIALKSAFNYAREGDTQTLKPDTPFVRFFIDDYFFDENVGFRQFHSSFNNALSGGVFIGHPKFGDYELAGYGTAKNSRGEEGRYFDLYPAENVCNYPTKSPQEICDAVMTNKPLLAQFERDYIVEVQSSSGLAVYLADDKPVVQVEPALKL